MGYIILFLLNLLFPFAGAGVILTFLFSPRRKLLGTLQTELPQRLGLRASGQVLGGYIWLHAASVGEVKSVLKIAQELKDFYSRPILLTATTAAGRIAAQKEPVFDTVALAPLDFYPSVKNFIKIYKPHRLFVVEADLWPNMIVCCGAHAVPTAVINGRLSARSAKRYRLLAPLVRLVFKNIAFVCAQSADIAQRYIALGLNAARAHAVGNIKYDMLNEHPPRAEEAQKLIAALGWQDGPIITCGSTHEEEERAIYAAAKQMPQTKFIIAPRHLERKKQILAMLEESALKYSVLGKMGAGKALYPGSQILFADSMGWLSALYSVCSAVFVGGSIARRGGHNFLEAAILGKPVFFGEHYYNTPDVAAKLLASGGGILVDAQNFAQVATVWTGDPQKLAAAGAAAKETALSFKGATAKTMAIVEDYETRK